jgi:hypothetical protein
MFTNELVSEICDGLGIRCFDEVKYCAGKKLVADATQSVVLRLGRERWILIVSNEVSPLIVKRGTDLQREAKSLLHGNAAAAIELPLMEGLYGARSYALWRMRRPVSSNRVLSKLQMIMLAPRVYRWLRDVTAQTIGPAQPDMIARNLGRLESVRALPESIKAAAERARTAVISGVVPARQQMQHGDLWIGNILMAPNTLGFIVIDWPGAKTLGGMPLFDLLKFAISVRASRSALRREIDAHAAILGCKPEHAIAFVLSGLGRLYTELECFPENRFVELCIQKVNALDAANLA